MLEITFRGILTVIMHVYTHFCVVTQMVKNLSAIQEIQVQSLDQGDPLEKKMSTHSSILAWGISCTEEPGGLQRSPRVEHN